MKGGNLPFASQLRQRLHVDLEPSRLVRRVRQPTAVLGNLPLEFLELALQQRLRPASAIERQRPQIPAGLRIQHFEHDQLSIRRPARGLLPPLRKLRGDRVHQNSHVAGSIGPLLEMSNLPPYWSAGAWPADGRFEPNAMRVSSGDQMGDVLWPAKVSRVVVSRDKSRIHTSPPAAASCGCSASLRSLADSSMPR